MKCSSRLVRPCTASSVGPLGASSSSPVNHPQGALDRLGQRAGPGQVDPTRLGGFNLFLTGGNMAAGTSSRLVPKRHLINMVAMYIPIIRRAVARRCRLEVDSPAGFEEFHDGFSELRCVESCGGLSEFVLHSVCVLDASKCRFVWSVSRGKRVCSTLPVRPQVCAPAGPVNQQTPPPTATITTASIKRGRFLLFHAPFGETLNANLPLPLCCPESFMWEI